MRIAADGTWFYAGTPIQRPAMIALFAGILRKDPERYVLVTPAECVGITVEDVPFSAVAMREQGRHAAFHHQPRRRGRGRRGPSPALHDGAGRRGQALRPRARRSLGAADAIPGDRPPRSREPARRADRASRRARASSRSVRREPLERHRAPAIPRSFRGGGGLRARSTAHCARPRARRARPRRDAGQRRSPAESLAGHAGLSQHHARRRRARRPRRPARRTIRPC